MRNVSDTYQIDNAQKGSYRRVNLAEPLGDPDDDNSETFGTRSYAGRGRRPLQKAASPAPFRPPMVARRSGMGQSNGSGSHQPDRERPDVPAVFNVIAHLRCTRAFEK